MAEGGEGGLRGSLVGGPVDGASRLSDSWLYDVGVP